MPGKDAYKVNMGSLKEPIKAGQTGYGTDFKDTLWMKAEKLSVSDRSRGDLVTFPNVSFLRKVLVLTAKWLDHPKNAWCFAHSVFHTVSQITLGS